MRSLPHYFHYCHLAIDSENECDAAIEQNTIRCILQALVDLYPEQCHLQTLRLATVLDLQALCEKCRSISLHADAANIFHQGIDKNLGSAHMQSVVLITSCQDVEELTTSSPELLLAFCQGVPELQAYIRSNQCLFMEDSRLLDSCTQENPLIGTPHQTKRLTGTTRLFISGDRSQVGKSTICLGLLASFLKMGYQASELAYIKPATQCEAEQLVTKFCHATGIAAQGVGPIVFYTGFTRAYLQGETLSSEEMLAQVGEACDALARDVKVLVVDGVGYPAVGSICQVSNAQVARAARASVLLVGKAGVGDAVDSFHLNATYFESHQVRVLGGVFNRFQTEGFYSLDKCKESIMLYFKQFRSHQLPFGFLPMLPTSLELLEARKDDAAESKRVSILPIVGTPTNEREAREYARIQNQQLPSRVELSANERQFVHVLTEAMMQRVDLTRLLHEAAAAANEENLFNEKYDSKATNNAIRSIDTQQHSRKRKSRTDIQRTLSKSGAAGA